ncbi:hypothetical protein AVEN_67017-1 [Araneus ventricosus]|uniref:Uncharacterized protein n=1 Tax=Araneus ventricosus TaxID=182803 RepID=A0A4Y2E5E9_ARAVE|nr:hypothetical protein AVEN_99663-1 [Araneus ventricosus]GBM23035.1 hypothetical protein AVEN_67017-1 [Araneus ventricosus]
MRCSAGMDYHILNVNEVKIVFLEVSGRAFDKELRTLRVHRTDILMPIISGCKITYKAASFRRWDGPGILELKGQSERLTEPEPSFRDLNRIKHQNISLNRVSWSKSIKLRMK